MATLPVLPLADAVLLPGMVIPVTLDPGTQAAIDAARATGDDTVVAVPRIEGSYGPVGTTALVEKVGRLPIGWARQHVAELEVAEKIGDEVREGMERNQREFLLRQQLAAIRKELGEGEPDGSADYRARVEAADLPEKVREAALREVGKLERASDQAPEAGWIRTWLDTVLELPWNTRTEDNTDLAAARAVLDADHAGLADVKDRILEYLAVRDRRSARNLQVVGGRGSRAVLAPVGPPGRGQTSPRQS